MDKFVIHSIYDGFLADRDQIVFTANLKGARKFKSAADAKVMSEKLEKDGKLVPKGWHILGMFD